MTSSRSSPEADVLFAGDLVEQGAPPSFGDAYPLDWPATLGQLLDLAADGHVVPGHGEVVERDFVAAQLGEIAFLAELARRQWPDLRAAGHDPAGPAPADLVEESAHHLGWPTGAVSEALGRAIRQAAGLLGVQRSPDPRAMASRHRSRARFRHAPALFPPVRRPGTGTRSLPAPSPDRMAIEALPVCLQCGSAAARPGITFCRRCGLPFGDAPRADAELPTCPICYRTAGPDGLLPSPLAPGHRVSLAAHQRDHDRAPVGDDDWLESLREGSACGSGAGGPRSTSSGTTW